MSPPLEHDYITLAESAAAEKLSGGSVSASSVDGAALKATELRLGPPGSESPDRSIPQPLGLTLGLKTFSSAGAKRGFSDAIIDGASHKWPFAAGGSDADSGKNAGLFSPRGDTRAAGNAVKDAAAGGTAAAKSAVAAAVQEKKPQAASAGAPAAKAQVVGWPPIRSYRKNTMAANPLKNKEDAEGKQAPGCLYVKVSMDGAPYLRKVDLKLYSNYKELSSALEKMFSCFTIGQCESHGIPGRDGLSKSRLMDLLHGSEYVLTYEDKDGDWMLVGDVPWEIFTDSCKRLRIMKGSDAIGLAPRAMEKCESRN